MEIQEYKYKARDSMGKLTSGEIEAKNEEEVRHFLTEQKLIPVEIKTTSMTFSLDVLIAKIKKPSLKNLISFTRQFYSMFKAGVHVNKIFTVLIKQTKNKTFNNTLTTIQNDIQKGSPLSKAFASHPKIFNKIFINMIKIGEEGGVLDKTLQDLYKLMEKDYKIKKKIKSATLYPKIVVFVLLGVTVFALLYIIPAFKDFYSSYGSILPLPTRMLLSLSNFTTQYWYLFFLFIISIIILFKKLTATEKGRMLYDKFKYKIPIFGNLGLQFANSRFGHLLSSLYHSGLPMLESLDIISNAIGNVAYEAEIKKLRNRVATGSTLAGAMSKLEYFTPTMIEATAVGEESGSLDEMLEAVAIFYDEEIDYVLENLSTLIEPILLISIFSMVGLLAFAIYLPIFNLSHTVLGK